LQVRTLEMGEARLFDRRRKEPLVLVVDDDLPIVKLLRARLHSDGFEVLVATDGAQALELIEKEAPDLVVLDIMLPKLDGMEVCRRVREWSMVPVIMLSARSSPWEKVECFNLGADDYVTKPFAPEEMIARVRSVMRRAESRGAGQRESKISRGNVTVDLAKRRIAVDGNELKLTPTEYALLQELMTNAGVVLTHGELLTRVWGSEYVEDKGYLHVFISRLRSKMEVDPTEPKHIITVAGVGYMFQD